MMTTSNQEIVISAYVLAKILAVDSLDHSKESAGLLLGYVDEETQTLVITDFDTGKQQQTSTYVVMDDEALVQIAVDLQQRDSKETIVGWAHTHPSYGCFLSGTDKSTQRTYQSLFSKKNLLIFSLILLLAGFLRLYKLDSQSFIADEYLGVNIGYGYHKSGEWKNWDFNTESLSEEPYTRAKIYYWQVAKSFSFLDLNEGSARLLSVFWGLVGMFVVFVGSYFFTRNVLISIMVDVMKDVVELQLEATHVMFLARDDIHQCK